MWSTRTPATTPSPTSSSTLACVVANTSGSSTRTPARSSMSKNRRWPPPPRGAPPGAGGGMGDGKNPPMAAPFVEVEELRPQRLVTPERVLVRGRHVVGHDVEHDVQTLGGERAQRRFASEHVGDTRRV